MQAFFLSLIFTAIRRVITAALFAHILKLVEVQTSAKMSGPDKKAAVIAELNALKGDLSVAVKSLPSAILSMAVDIAVAEIKGNLVSNLK